MTTWNLFGFGSAAALKGTWAISVAFCSYLFVHPRSGDRSLDQTQTEVFLGIVKQEKLKKCSLPVIMTTRIMFRAKGQDILLPAP